MATGFLGRSRGGRGGVTLLLVPLLVAAGLCGTVRGVTPDSPQVRELVEKGLKFLENSDHDRVGGKCLIGLSFYKDNRGKDHPKVVAAIDACTAVASAQPENIHLDLYSTGIAIIFLCEIDPSKYRVEIERLIKSLELRQKPHGGWGYPDGQHAGTGDTSMTQYAVLSLWTASRTDVVEIPLEPVERVCNWLIRTQDPSGGWGYQGNDPGPEFTHRVQQENVRHSLSAAGLGSLLMCSDLLGFVEPAELEEDSGLPPALTLVKEQPQPGAGVLAKTVDGRQLEFAIREGNGWFARNYDISPKSWTYYYMYAFERYQSFRELAAGKFEREPRWYGDGVRYLTKAQGETGAWEDRNGAADTAFAILFLLRSTKKTIEKSVRDMGDGTLVGGRGLPGDVRELLVRRGRIVGQAKEGEPDDLLSILEDPDDPDFDYMVEFPSDLTLSNEPPQRARQLARLRRLVRAENYQSRKVAVRVLARSRDLDSVPELIYALGDPDGRVVQEARDGLRFLSRRFDGFGLPDRPTRDQQLRAIDDWKQWYLTVRPGAEFLQ